MPDIYEIARTHRKALLAGERESALRMVDAYGTAYQSIKDELTRILDQITEARANGEDVSLAWLYRADRLQRLADQARRQVDQFALTAGLEITRQQAQMVQAAQENAQQLILAGLGPTPATVSVSFTRLPHEALTDLVGFLSDGSPLSALLSQLGIQASDGIRKALVSGLATGQGVRQIARNVREASAVPLDRALRISRTEVLRSYRTASLRSYQENSDVCRGWRWVASKSRRTCAVCLAMDGTEHPLDEEFASHVCCRCSPSPITKSWAELGIEGVDEPQQPPETGAAWFERQPEATRRHILGPGKYALYQTGAIDLTDLVGEKQDPRWGPSRFERPLKDLI